MSSRAGREESELESVDKIEDECDSVSCVVDLGKDDRD